MGLTMQKAKKKLNPTEETVTMGKAMFLEQYETILYLNKKVRQLEQYINNLEANLMGKEVEEKADADNSSE